MSSDVALVAERRGEVTVYPFERARELGVDAFITDRFGGVSAAPYDTLNLGTHVGDNALDVEENRRRVARAANVTRERLVIVHQVHGRAVLEASGVSATSEADALVTDDDELALAMLVADCVPVLIIDAASRRVALIHAGWRGLRSGVVDAATIHFANAATLHAFVGPSISKEGYQVGPEVAKHFADVPNALTPDGGDRSRLDLRLVATERLTRRGVLGDNVVQCQQVTDGGEVFFSDRAQRPCGRFALVAKRVS